MIQFQVKAEPEQFEQSARFCLPSEVSQAVPSQVNELDVSLPVRILKMITIFAFGGTERQVVNLVTRLDRSKFNLEMACMKKSGQFLNEINQDQIPVSEFPINCLYKPGTFMQQARFAAHLKRQKIQIAHSYNFYSNVFAVPAAKLAGVPVTIASIRDRGVYLTPAKKLVQKYICNLADSILVNADSIRDWLVEEGYQEKKITVIRNGLDLSLYGKRPKNFALQREFGFPDSSPLVMMMSRLDQQKGIEDLLHAAVIIIRHCPKTRFLIVGESLGGNSINRTAGLEYMRKLEQLVIDLDLTGHVVFTGYRSDVPDMLAQATVSVLPSYSEGLSNSLLEAMASGVPVVATNVGGNPELVKHDECGLLTPPRDPVALAIAICAILQNPDLANSLGAAARQRVENHFSMEGMVNTTQDLYIELLKQQKSKKR